MRGFAPPSAAGRSVTVALAALLLLAGCSGLRVLTDYDVRFDFAGRSSYAWLEPPVVEATLPSGEATDPFARNSLLDERVRHAVDRTLASRGFRISEEDPAYRVRYYVVLESRTRIRSTGGGFYGAYSGGYYGGMAGATSYDYKQGTLIIDFIDARTGRLAWRGWAAGANRQGYYDEARVDASVDEILARFPPGHAQ